MSRPLALPFLLAVTGLSLLACSGISFVHKPEIQTLSASATELTEGESVTVTALVTDPEGASNVLSGTLVDAETGDLYGTFTGRGAGSFDMALSWDDLNAVMDIDLAEGASGSRTLSAAFLDEEGHESAPQSISLTLSCGVDAACAGACADFDADTDNCGACGNTCRTYDAYDSSGLADHPAECDAGQCVVSTDCETEIFDSCDDMCAEQGYAGCSDGDYTGFIFTTDRGGCGGDMEDYFEISRCDESQSRRTEYDAMHCACLE